MTHEVTTQNSGQPDETAQPAPAAAPVTASRDSKPAVIPLGKVGYAVLSLLLLALLGGAMAGAGIAFSAARESSPGFSAEPASAQGEVRTVDLGGGLGLELVWVEAGNFQMGTSTTPNLDLFGPGEKDFADEVPGHPVTLTGGFWLGRFEVTNEQFRRFRPDHMSGRHRGHSLEGLAQPVVNVSWEDALAFCRWLSTRTGLDVRLPSEAEWEYACRAGSTTQFSQGDSPASLEGFANAMNPEVARSFGYGWTPFPWEDGSHVTAPVGQYQPNAWGLYDMHGNAWEWCNDWYEDSYYARSPAQDPPGPDSGNLRVLRGGSWSDTPWFCRSSFRIGRKPDSRRIFDGFRIAITAARE